MTHQASTEAQSVCPRCGSDDPTVCFGDSAANPPRPHKHGKHGKACCGHEFHKGHSVPSQSAPSRGIDGKFSTDGVRIFNTVSGEAIPEDEPLFLLRARDNKALTALNAYRDACAAECNDLHLAGIEQVRTKFLRFIADHPERMKQPGITRHLKLEPAGAQPKEVPPEKFFQQAKELGELCDKLRPGTGMAIETFVKMAYREGAEHVNATLTQRVKEAEIDIKRLDELQSDYAKKFASETALRLDWQLRAGTAETKLATLTRQIAQLKEALQESVTYIGLAEQLAQTQSVRENALACFKRTHEILCQIEESQ